MTESGEQMPFTEKELRKSLMLFRVTSENDKNEFLERLSSLDVRHICFIDPYFFSASDIKVLFESGTLCEEIRILSSDEPPSSYKDDEYQWDVAFRSIKASLRELFLTYGVQNYHLKLMTGLKSGRKPYHDRFVITETRCWMIGASWNQLGRGKLSYIIDVDCCSTEKGDNLVLPRSQVIRNYFETFWDEIGNIEDGIE